MENSILRLNGISIEDGSNTTLPAELSIISLVTTGDVTASNFSKDESNDTRVWKPWGTTHFNTILEESEVESIEGYLAHKWELTGSLPDSHPYKNAPTDIQFGSAFSFGDGKLIKSNYRVALLPAQAKDLISRWTLKFLRN